MFEFNNKFWNEFEPGYYDKNFKPNRVDNNIQQLWHYLTFKIQEPYLTSSKVHLDYACGPGTQVGLFSNSKSLGYDLSEKQVKYAIKKYKSKEKQFTSDYGQIKNFGKFDIITVNGLIEYLPNSEILELIAVIKQVSKNGATILITTPNYSLLFYAIEKISTYFGIKDYNEVSNNKFNKKSLEKLLNKSEAEVISIKKIINFGVLFAFINSDLAIKIEKFFEKLFNNKLGFILMAELKI